MAGVAHPVFGAYEHIEPGHDRIRAQLVGLLFQDRALLTRDAQRLFFEPGTIDHHEITPVFNELVKQLSQLQPVIDRLGQ